ncbi:MAG: type II secretion system F family protein [Actinomycetota bacterium]|nr:MAG: type II secretion system F family protein [Actinomycetota bacterium]
MATFDYRARDNSGEIISATLEAASEDALITKLKDQDLLVLEIKKHREEKIKGTKKSFSFFNRIKPRDLAVFTRQFATLISSGMSLIESLVVLERQTANPKFIEIIASVRMDIESGHSLSEGMSKHKIFTKLYLSLIRAGETGGVLDESMENLADFLEKDEDIRLQIRNKTAYPKFVLGFAVVITLVIIVFLVPTFKEIYDDLGVQLPAMTRAVIWVGDLFKNIFFYIITIVLIVGGRYLFKKFRETQRGRYIIDNIRINVPKMGDVIKKMALSRFARYLGTLLSAGVPILSALDIVKGVTDNVLIDNAIGDIKNNIRRGENISGPMAKNNVFPPMMVQMTAVGEKTGTLDTNLIRISNFYDTEVASTIEILLAILEPVMLLFVALIVGTIVISMYLPLFNIYQAM